jgi:hypothetical protein
MRARSTVAAQLIGQQKLRDHLLVSFVNMNILDRARWIQFGTSLKPTIGNTLVFAELAAAMIGAWMWLAR